MELQPYNKFLTKEAIKYILSIKILNPKHKSETFITKTIDQNIK